MDLSSSDKYIEDTVKEDEAHVEGEVDLNTHTRKVDQGGEYFQHGNELSENMIQVDSYHEYPDPPMPTVCANSEGLDSPIMKSDLVGPSSPSRKIEEAYMSCDSDVHHDVDDRRISDYNSEKVRSPTEDYYYNNKVETGNLVALSCELIDNNADEIFKNKTQAEDSDPYIEKPLLSAEDNNNSNEGIKSEGFDYQFKKLHTSDEMRNGDFGTISGNSELEKAGFVNKEMDDGSYATEMKDDVYPLGTVPSDQEGRVMDLHSPWRTQNATPSPKGQQLDFEERSPTQLSPKTDTFPGKQKVQSPEGNDKQSAPSPSQSKRKRSPSPEKHSLGHKRVSSRDHHSPSERRRSPSGRTSDSYHRDHSSRKHSSPSPRRRESPRRKDRSESRSPIRKRDSSGYRRDLRGRSRSRSPYERDHSRRSPRRRHSPRHRTPPGYYSRRRSPRRPWSPPANRNTGIGRPGRNLFVAGFSYITTERDLEKKFSRFGRVTDVRIVRDRRSGESRGFGFLSLERDEDADAAIRALDQTEWNGRIVLVEKSKTSAR